MFKEILIYSNRAMKLKNIMFNVDMKKYNSPIRGSYQQWTLHKWSDNICLVISLNAKKDISMLRGAFTSFD